MEFILLCEWCGKVLGERSTIHIQIVCYWYVPVCVFAISFSSCKLDDIGQLLWLIFGQVLASVCTGTKIGCICAGHWDKNCQPTQNIRCWCLWEMAWCQTKESGRSRSSSSAMAWPAAQNGVWKGLREDNSNWSRPKLQSRPAAEPKNQRCFLIKRLLTRAYQTRTLPTFPIVQRGIIYLIQNQTCHLYSNFTLLSSQCWFQIHGSRARQCCQHGSHSEPVKRAVAV